MLGALNVHEMMARWLRSPSEERCDPGWGARSRQMGLGLLLIPGGHAGGQHHLQSLHLLPFLMAGKHIRIWAAILIGMAAFIGSWRLLRVPERPAQLTVELEVVSRFTETWDLFYDDLHFTYGADRMVHELLAGHAGPADRVPDPSRTARVQGSGSIPDRWKGPAC